MREKREKKNNERPKGKKTSPHILQQFREPGGVIIRSTPRSTAGGTKRTINSHGLVGGPGEESVADTETDMIDAKSQEIRPVDGEVYSKMEDLADDLPDSSPRFILLSYPLTIVSLRHNYLILLLLAVLLLLVLLYADPAGWPSRRPLRPALLPARELQSVTENELRRCGGADEERGGGEPGDRGRERDGRHRDREEASITITALPCLVR
ncbi:hypothetical protein TRV_04921 [Trichophyton verrucosum HKI 0517]|uniref:Uncharacterized protein n=1 Tax=Trichophyton verrucosum (strain HKI 0517) TaxID=663202 RepID=D4DCR6_TRIVH|nr:uncharacterized protein TRV_04921 [Trichophyton verrucosum HKI 0517]EFE40357.1 hypothetical protein TRV_04921 [Trichophyton verrucosum HKI 0517]